MTDDLTPPGKVPADEIPATVIQAVAEKLFHDYDGADHQTWQDFEAQARQLLQVAADVPATWTPPLRLGNHSPLNIWGRDGGRDVMVAVAHSPAHAARLVSLVNEPVPTQWAYDQACKALETHRQRADRAEAANARARKALADAEHQTYTCLICGDDHIEAVRAALHGEPNGDTP